MLDGKLQKLVDLVTSRKFLAAVAAILVVFKVVPDSAESPLVEAALTAVTAVGYIIGVAVEDAGKNG